MPQTQPTSSFFSSIPSFKKSCFTKGIIAQKGLLTSSIHSSYQIHSLAYDLVKNILVLFLLYFKWILYQANLTLRSQ